MRRFLALLLVPLFASACGGDAPSADAAEPSPPVAEAGPPAVPAGPVDSSMTPGEALRRFREGLPEPRALSGGARSREALVRRFVEAVEAHDTAAIRSVVMSRAEFAYLYYPTSPVAKMRPDLAWFLSQQNSEKGIVRLLRRAGGTGMRYVRHACEPTPRQEGENRVWEKCLVTFTQGADTTTIRMFGSVIERGGAFKLVSYANDL
ncbi:MAG TPA: hypothetical protein VHG91_04465 [Longimicrobium sp.]|nr:hypothetical protein [Longimicrobium sp.]